MPVQDGLRDISKFMQGLAQRFEKLKIVEVLSKTTENVIKSVDNFSRGLTKKFQVKRASLTIGQSIKGFGSKLKKLGSKGNAEDILKTIQLPPRSGVEINGIVQHNVELIKTVGKEYLGKIQDRIVENIENGSSQKELEAMLARDTGVERNKARFWASDQLGKTFSELNKKNQMSADFERYFWRTQQDDRVRDTHEALEGTVHSWDDPPVIDGIPRHPGEDYNCRCFSEPALPDDK